MNDYEPVKESELTVEDTAPKPYGSYGMRIATHWRKERPEMAAELDTSGTFDQMVAETEARFLEALLSMEADLEASGMHPMAAEAEAVRVLLPSFLETGAETNEDLNP